MSFEQVEECWDLIDRAREFAKQAGEPKLEDYWDGFFAKEALVDRDRTIREGGSPPTRVFLTSPYGCQWRPEHRDWIPFRHGEVTLPPLDLD